MAIAFAEVKTHSRKVGHSAVAAAAYRTRSRMVCERTGEVFDWSDRAEELEHTGLSVPQTARDWLQERRAAGQSPAAIRSALWNEVEAKERRGDARIGRDLTVATPWELSPAQRHRLNYAIAKMLAERHGVAVEYSAHQPHMRAGDDHADARNFHTHFHATPRRMTVAGLTEKARELDNPRESGPHIDAWRAGIQELVNSALSRAGYDQSHFIDMRSYARQGVNREAQRHKGSKATALDRTGIDTDVEAYNAAIRQRNAARAQAEQRERLPAHANVIDFEAKRQARDQRRTQALLYQQSVHHQTRLREALAGQRRLEEQLKAQREAAEQRQQQEADRQTPPPEKETPVAEPVISDEIFDPKNYQSFADELDQVREAERKQQEPLARLKAQLERQHQRDDVVTRLHEARSRLQAPQGWWSAWFARLTGKRAQAEHEVAMLRGTLDSIDTHVATRLKLYTQQQEAKKTTADPPVPEEVKRTVRHPGLDYRPPGTRAPTPQRRPSPPPPPPRRSPTRERLSPEDIRLLAELRQQQERARDFHRAADPPGVSPPAPAPKPEGLPADDARLLAELRQRQGYAQPFTRAANPSAPANDHDPDAALLAQLQARQRQSRTPSNDKDRGPDLG